MSGRVYGRYKVGDIRADPHELNSIVTQLLSKADTANNYRGVEASFAHVQAYFERTLLAKGGGSRYVPGGPPTQVDVLLTFTGEHPHFISVDLLL